MRAKVQPAGPAPIIAIDILGVVVEAIVGDVVNICLSVN